MILRLGDREGGWRSRRSAEEKDYFPQSGLEPAGTETLDLTLDGCKKVKYYDSSNDEEELLMNLEENWWNKAVVCFNAARMIRTCKVSKDRIY